MSIYVPAQRSAPESEAATAAPAPVAESGWGGVVRVAVARASLAMVLSLVFWSLLPLLAGWTPRVILSGSMEPRVHVGDIIVTREVPAANLAKGQVITVTDPDHPEKTRTHRVLRREADGQLVLKGDANQTADSTPVSVDDVLGVGVVRVPFVGRPAYWMAERNWLPLGATTLFLGWCLLTVLPSSRRSEDTPDDMDRPGPPSSGPRHARPRRIAATVAVAAISVGAAAGPADAAFKRSIANPVSTFSSVSTFFPYKSEVLGDSPFLYWKLDETSGTAITDSSGGTPRPGTLLSGGHSLGVASPLAEKPSRAIDFSMAAISANSSSTMSSSFSVEAWVKTSSGNGGRILGFGNGSGQNASSTVDRQLYVGTNGRVYFGIGTAKTVVASSGSVNNNQWHHVVGTYTIGNNGMKLYVDGVLQGQTRATTALNSGFWRAGAEGMSGWTSNPGQFLDGALDELAVYSDVLTPTEVQAHYNAAD